MVLNFEWKVGELLPLPDSADLGAASAALPGGAYTTLRTYGGRRFLRLQDHIERLARSAGGELPPPWVREAMRAALGATAHPESRLRLTFAPPRLFVSVERFTPLPADLYRDGARCATVPLQRERPQAKDTAFIATAASAYRRLPAGVHEGLLVTPEGAILEGLSSNFFAVRQGTLRTEGARALPGITRSLVLDVAEGILPVELTAVHVADLTGVQECFVTSASRGMLPVVAVDEVVIGTGRPGPITTELRRRFDARIDAEAEEV
ncbi:MAG TPA: aminotransferase class IV [Vicinamibacteria bacterium]|nr:aminotransferase class IV [Vicinamibacteria bacterium]